MAEQSHQHSTRVMDTKGTDRIKINNRLYWGSQTRVLDADRHYVVNRSYTTLGPVNLIHQHIIDNCPAVKAIVITIYSALLANRGLRRVRLGGRMSMLAVSLFIAMSE